MLQIATSRTAYSLHIFSNAKATMNHHYHLLHRRHHHHHPLILLLVLSTAIVFHSNNYGTASASKSRIIFSLHRPSQTQASAACFSQHDTTPICNTANTAFNHDCIGITNPTVSATNPLMKRLQQAAASMLLGNNNTQPSLQMNNNNNNESTCINSVTMETKEGWRIIRKRRIVGKGEAAYWTARDAMLGWEGLHTGSKWAGIHLLRRQHRVNINDDNNNVHINSNSNTVQPATRSTTTTSSSSVLNDTDDDDGAIRRSSRLAVEADPLRAPTSDNVLQITSSPGLKRLTTFSRILPGLPLWAVNPCMVLYDLVDERSSSGMTYSATAYGTMRGHLLRGEERVCVSMCDQSREVVVEVLSYSHATSGFLGNVIFRACRGMQDRFFQEEVDVLAAGVAVAYSAPDYDDGEHGKITDAGMDMTMTLFDGNNNTCTHNSASLARSNNNHNRRTWMMLPQCNNSVGRRRRSRHGNGVVTRYASQIWNRNDGSMR